MSFKLMLLILFAFLYFGIGFGTMLKFNMSVSGLSIRAKMILFLPLQTILLTFMVYFDILPEILKNSIKTSKRKVIVPINILRYIFYVFCTCLKFSPIMSAMLAQLIIEKNRTSKYEIKEARYKYSNMIGSLIMIHN